jgi:transposase
MSKKIPRKIHTTEFREEAIKLAEKVGVAQAAKRLGVYPSQIYAWRAALSKKQTSGDRESSQAAEIVRLKRLLAEQAEDLEILKKAATYFAKQQK